MTRSLILVSILSLAACADVAQPFDLDHARVIAVRVDPPAIPAGGVAQVDVLYTDSSAQPRLATDAEVSVSLPAGFGAAAGLVTLSAHHWQLTAPDEAALATIRAATGLAPGAEVIVPLELVVTTLDGPLHATKTLALGTTAHNPAPPSIVLDGSAGSGGAPFALTLGTEAKFAVAAPDPGHDYRWFSSVGDLIGFTRPEVTVDPAAAATGDTGAGVVVVVERDQAGGTSWALAPAEVTRAAP